MSMGVLLELMRFNDILERYDNMAASLLLEVKKLRESQLEDATRRTNEITNALSILTALLYIYKLLSSK